MDQHRVLPFYMTYPLPMYYEKEDTVMRDLEYLQQMYPKEAKKYQKRISDILDKLDYNGSVIYDEFPDKWTLYKMANDILKMLEGEEVKEQGDGFSKEKWEWMEDMVQILLFFEIYKRRHCRGRRYLKF